jgi:hypothetical protein
LRQRGRPSAASLATIAVPLEVVERVRAPHDLNDEETEVWVSVVNCEPADWFTQSTIPLLTQYCRHVVQTRRIAELIERGTSDPSLEVKDYDRLLHMQQRESAIMMTLATKMRITNQSTINQRGNKISRTRKKPWEG